MKVRIRQATRKGYIECSVPGVFDMNYPNSSTRCGRVKGGGKISPTICANSNEIYVVCVEKKAAICAIRTRAYAGIPMRVEIGGGNIPFDNYSSKRQHVNRNI